MAQNTSRDITKKFFLKDPSIKYVGQLNISNMQHISIIKKSAGEISEAKAESRILVVYLGNCCIGNKLTTSIVRNRDVSRKKTDAKLGRSSNVGPAGSRPRTWGFPIVHGDRSIWVIYSKKTKLTDSLSLICVSATFFCIENTSIPEM